MGRHADQDQDRLSDGAWHRKEGHKILGYGDSTILNAKFDKEQGCFISGPEMVHAQDLLMGGYILGTAQANERAQQDVAVAAKRGVSKEKLPELLPIRTAGALRRRTVTQGLEGTTAEQTTREHGEAKSGIRELVDILSGKSPHVGSQRSPAAVEE